MLGAGAVALLPLAVLIVAQILWLDDLRRSEELARRAILGDYLRSLDSEMQRYVESFDAPLDLPSELLCPFDAAAIGERMRRATWVGVTHVAIGTWCGGERLVYVDPRTGAVAAPPSAAARDAVKDAFEVWEASDEALVEVEGTGLVVDENAPHHRLVIHPVYALAASQAEAPAPAEGDGGGGSEGSAGAEVPPPARTVALVAAILDEPSLRAEILPKITARRVEVDGEHVVGVTIRDADDVILYASDPASGPHRDEIVEEFSLLYPDLSVGVGILSTSTVELARANFTLNVLLALALGGALLGGVGLLLRTAAREHQLSELKSDFVANVSHELKTPIASIQLFAELLRDGRASSPEKVREYGGLIDKESRRLTSLVDTILDLARFESGAGVVIREGVAVDAIVAQIVERVAARDGNGGRLRYAPPAEPLPAMAADPAALDRAIGNLVSNALKYSAADAPVEVRVALRGEAIEVEVEDRGVGVPEADREQIFERFHRLQRGPVHDVKGAGLGLAITRFIVEAHGGRVRVASEVGRGSTFTISLPQRVRARGGAAASRRDR
ncbi:MAG: HAMP domain-containing sensor histidine kinase [Nannocystaceae bacterium]